MTLNLLFNEMNIKYISQYKFKDLLGDYSQLKFDYYLPEYNILIEYQGQQHYYSSEFFGGEKKFQLQQKYDNLKREYCKNNGYNLIEIPYWDYEKLDEKYIENILKINNQQKE